MIVLFSDIQLAAYYHPSMRRMPIEHFPKEQNGTSFLDFSLTTRDKLLFWNPVSLQVSCSITVELQTN